MRVKREPYKRTTYTSRCVYKYNNRHRGVSPMQTTKSGKKIETDNDVMVISSNSSDSENSSDSFKTKVEQIVQETVTEKTKNCETNEKASVVMNAALFKSLFTVVENRPVPRANESEKKRNASVSPNKDGATTSNQPAHSNKKRCASVAAPAAQPVPTHNSYEPLVSDPDSDLGDDEDDVTNSVENIDDASINQAGPSGISSQSNKSTTATTTAPNATTTQSKQRIAPIIIAGKATSHKPFVATLNEKVKKGYTISYSKNNLNLYLHDLQEKKQMVETLRKSNVEFHTYTDADNKTHAFVLRGLDCEPSPQELQAELETTYEQLKIKAIYRMTTQHRPLYLVVTSTATTLQTIQRDVKTIMYTRVSWQRHVNKKQLSQCHRCQMWGHATANCMRTPRCLKCAEQHITRECTKPKTTPAKCINCSADHPANSVQCAVYIARIKQRQLNIEKRAPAQSQQRYQPAPAPQVNQWSQRGPHYPQCSDSDVRQSARNLQARDEFPPLPGRQRQQSAPQPPPSQPAVNPSPCEQSIYPEPSDQDTITLYKGITNEIQTLSTLINLGHMLIALQDLNQNLSKCKTDMEKFNTFFTFAQNISNYNI